MTWNSLKLLISNKSSRLVPNFFLFNFLFQTGVLGAMNKGQPMALIYSIPHFLNSDLKKTTTTETNSLFSGVGFYHLEK